MLSKQPGCAKTLRINDIHQGISVLGQTGRVDNYLVYLCHFLEEFPAARSDQHVDNKLTRVHLHWKLNMEVFWLFESAMDQCFVEIKY